MTLKTAHALSGTVIAFFFIFHLMNHLVGIIGVDAHIQLMETLRTVYRNTVVESVLMCALSFQVFSGVKFAFSGWKTRKGIIPWVQASSGLYLAFFFLNHVGSVMAGRYIMQLDTNYYFAITGIHVAPFQYFFIPYYFIAIVAVFAHMGCGLFWPLHKVSSRLARHLIVFMVVMGFVCSLLVTMAMSGTFYSIEVPDEYKATYQLDR